MKLTPQEHLILRSYLATATLRIQEEFSSTHTPNEFIPEFVAALVSLARSISIDSMGASEEEFLEIVNTAFDERPTH
jgi:hypothetical protein